MGVAFNWQKSIEPKVRPAAETLFPMCLLFLGAALDRYRSKQASCIFALRQYRNVGPNNNSSRTVVKVTP
jgi:hypothetical protein